MPVTYTNRKGVTYTLCQGVTKTGKPRYYFARQPKGEPVDEIPQGWRISESVNAIVSLVKDRPQQISPEEIAAVEAAIQRHPQARNYRVSVKNERIEIYELVGPDPDRLISDLGEIGMLFRGKEDKLRAILGRSAQFTPVLRFTLADRELRTFYAQRWCYRGSIDDWIHVGATGPVHRLARQLIPTLGTDRFFELY